MSDISNRDSRRRGPRPLHRRDDGHNRDGGNSRDGNSRDRNGTKLEYITDVVARRLHEKYDLPPEILASLRQE